ncbi:MAG: hypothetical protein FWG89_03395 [Treponema sp.]|nr:hypothetical protein [Treponema sp.]
MFLPLFILLFIFFSGCSAADIQGGRAGSTVDRSVTIDVNTRFQTIEGFGASDCWMVNFVGNYWDEPEKETLARRLFSQEINQDGSPEGIGLSMWRFNLGAGTYEQGAESGIPDIPRRAESFLADIYTAGTYDWSKQAGQQYFLRKARDYGVEHIVLFSNSPPVAFTVNGRGFADRGGRANLRDDAFNDFAVYLADAAANFRQEGIPVTYISPVNEPQYNWDGNSQEGSPWSNADIARLARELDREIQARALDTKILIPESGSWHALFENNGRTGNQIWAFFDPASPDYVGNLPAMPGMLGAHSLWSHGSDHSLRSTRRFARRLADRYNIELSQTEWSMLQGGDGLPQDINSAGYFDMALFMGKIIHCDMADAHVTSWSFWTSMDMDRHQYKNRYLLIALDPADGDLPHPVYHSGTVEARSTLWVLGNYSFFIRPGYTRIALDGADDTGSLMGSAYIAPDHSRIVAVYVNMDSRDHRVTTTINGLHAQPKTVNMYVSSDGRDLEISGPARSFDQAARLVIPARSVVTVVYNGDADPLAARTIDAVMIGDPESEFNHQFAGSNARGGFNNGGYWRDAAGDDGGFYRYTLETSGNENLALWVRYWGNDTGERAFSIYLDGEHLADEDISGKWSQDNFIMVEYPIPPALVRGKRTVTVQFRSTGSNIAGGIYGLRLVR